MRRLGIGLICLAAAGCSKAPDRSGPGDSVSAAAGIAFTYAYQLRLPSEAISAVQDGHARACERLGPRCRITGLGYHVDDAGIVSAELSLALAAPVARAFGRQAVGAAEAAGGALVGAEVTGGDAAATRDAGAAVERQGADEVARLDDQLARTDLPDRERAELRRQRAVAVAGRVAASTAARSAAADLATTPVAFRYTEGRGTGIGATIADAGQLGLASATTTLSILLRVIALLGPPAIVLGAVLLLWRRLLRGWWRRVSAERRSDAAPPV